MNKSKPIYTITTLRGVLFDNRARCVGYYHEFKDAEECVAGNDLDLNEAGYYPYAVIEVVEQGLYTFPHVEYWYKWNDDKGMYISCVKPQRFNRTVGWSMG